MKTVTITSQGQITLPAAIRREWGITGSQELQLTYDAEAKEVSIRKPITTAEWLETVDAITAKIPKGIAPLRAGNIHEFYERERTADIARKIEENC